LVFLRQLAYLNAQDGVCASRFAATSQAASGVFDINGRAAPDACNLEKTLKFGPFCLDWAAKRVRLQDSFEEASFERAAKKQASVVEPVEGMSRGPEFSVALR
jgi:hypothetical protein